MKKSIPTVNIAIGKFDLHVVFGCYILHLATLGTHYRAMVLLWYYAFHRYHRFLDQEGRAIND